MKWVSDGISAAQGRLLTSERFGGGGGCCFGYTYPSLLALFVADARPPVCLLVGDGDLFMVRGRLKGQRINELVIRRRMGLK